MAARSFNVSFSVPALLGVFLLLVGLFLAPAALAQKTDIVILTNGDRVTGEIKKLEAGLLQYKTDTMGTVQIEWRFIEQIITDKQQLIETVDGTRWLGKLQKPEEGDNVELITVRGPVEIEPQDVVSAWPVQATFWDKVDLNVSLGYDYAKSTGITNFSASADFLYRTDQRLIDSSARTNITRQDGADDQNRQEVRFNYQRLLENQRFRSLLAGYEVNEAIGLDRRIYGGAAFGKYLRKTNRIWFTVGGGLIGSLEDTVEGEAVESLEGVVSSRFRYFSYATPERVLDVSASVFPSLTESGRWRGDLRTTFRLELVTDLFWQMEFYGTYDSKPIDEGAEKSDYGVNTGLGYSF